MTDIARWLEGLGLGKYAATFADAEIDLAAVPHLTDDDLKVAEGNSEYLAGRIQERYGLAKDEAERAVRDFERGL